MLLKGTGKPLLYANSCMKLSLFLKLDSHARRLDLTVVFCFLVFSKCLALLHGSVKQWHTFKKKKASSVLKCTLKSMSVCKQSPACETSRHIQVQPVNSQNLYSNSQKCF